MLAYWVVQRRKELGIRMALGATRGGLWRLVVTGGIRLAAIGAVCAAVTIPLAGQLLKSMLYGVTSTDTVALFGAPMALIAVAAIASLGPAWSATRADPASSLRHD